MHEKPPSHGTGSQQKFHEVSLHPRRWKASFNSMACTVWVWVVGFVSRLGPWAGWYRWYPPIDGSLRGRHQNQGFPHQTLWFHHISSLNWICPEMGYQYTSKLPFWEYEFQTLDLGKHQSILSNGPWVDKAISNISFLEVTYCPEMWRLVSMFLLGWRWRNYPKLCVDPIKAPDYIFSVNLCQGIPWFDVRQWDTSAQKRLCASTSTYGGCPCNILQSCYHFHPKQTKSREYAVWWNPNSGQKIAQDWLNSGRHGSVLAKWIPCGNLIRCARKSP